MKYQGKSDVRELDGILLSKLSKYREERNFDVEEYLELKKKKFLHYFEQSGLDTAVVALSGGIDSAIVYAMLQYFKNSKENTQFKQIVPICLPALKLDKGATNQKELTEKVTELVTNFEQKYKEFNMTILIDALTNEIKAKLPDMWDDDSWAKGQVVSYLRTPVYYYLCSLLTAKGFKPVVVGTTNKDEGAYLGYFGKASDGLVDLQLISDIHKSEVYAVAKYLGVPRSILNAIPTGDMYDNRSDEEVFGTSYDFVELYLNYLEQHKGKATEKEYLESLGLYKSLFLSGAESLENLHKYNGHKYLGYSPAVHFDVIKGTELISGGWTYYNYEDDEKYSERTSDTFINQKQFKNSTLNILDAGVKDVGLDISNQKHPKVLDISNLITPTEVQAIIDDVNSQEWIPVGQNGMLKDYQEGDRIGSYRLSIYSNALAELIYNRIKDYVPKYKVINEFADCEWDNHKVWEFIGINPLFRFIKYKDDGNLVPHYDWSYIQDEDVRTLTTLVIYLEFEDCFGGNTRIIKDTQLKLEFNDRNLSDWEKTLTSYDLSLIESSHGGEIGGGLIFDHAILHDSEPLISGNKTIIRTDLMYKKHK